MCGGMDGGGIFNFLVATDTAAAQAKVNKAKVEARDAKNELEGAKSDLARFNQSLGNRKIMEAAGKRFNAITENIGRRQDARAYQGVMGQIALSEELGAATAAASSAGMGGDSVEQYNSTIKTVYGLQKDLADRAGKSEDYLAFQERGQIISQAVDAFNRDSIVANRDFTYYGPTKGPSLIGNLATLAVAAAATVAGAPQIGNAILKAKTANMQASYGDATGANKSFEGSLSAFGKGVGQVRDIFRDTKASAGLTTNVGTSGPSSDFWSGINYGSNSISFR